MVKPLPYTRPEEKEPKNVMWEYPQSLHARSDIADNEHVDGEVYQTVEKMVSPLPHLRPGNEEPKSVMWDYP